MNRDWEFVKRMFGEPSELYQLSSDPDEHNNLINVKNFAGMAKRLDAELTEFFAEHAEQRLDPWRGGTGKAILMYSDKSEKFINQFPDWQAPFVEQLDAFSGK